MVQSHIIKTVNYPEQSKLNLADKGHASSLYIVPIFEKTYVIVLGKQNTAYAKEGVVYYPIYLLNDKHKIKAKIGVYEAEVSIATSLLDDEGDVDLTQLNDPLLFSYVDTTYLDKFGTSGEDLSAKTMTPDEKEEVNIVPDESDTSDIDENGLDGEKKDEDEDEDDIFVIHQKKKTDEEETLPEDVLLTFDNVFTKEAHLPTLPTWTAETAEEAKIARTEYKKNKNVQDNWYVQKMENKEYKIHENEGSGDCFFATVRDSFAQLGYITTVQKLRAYLAQEVDIGLLEQYQEIYRGIEGEAKLLDHEINALQKTNMALKKQSDKTEKIEHQKDIVKEALHVKKEFNDRNIQKLGTTDLMHEFAFVKNLRTIDDLKAFVQTSEYWADHWAFDKIEILVKSKCIVIEHTDDRNQMLRCTEAHKEDFDPTYYILLAYYGDRHYELVSYKDKKIFKFGEIPFDIKKLVVDKCMEKSTGVFNRIASFRQFQTDLGIDAPSAHPPASSSSSSSELYNSKLVLSFHARSDEGKKPGMVPADEIPTSHKTEFAVLSGMKSWRRRLDDSWVGDGKTSSPFTTEDGNRWSSVDHYMIAIRFKESNPAIYLDFCADTAIGKELKNAHSAITKKKKEDKDKDDYKGKHFDAWKKTSPLEETVREGYRKQALTAKFTQNLDMKALLKATGMARLEHYIPRSPPFVDIPLMEVRATLSKNL